MDPKTRILCICQGGKVRSRALANELQDRGYRASFCGLKHKRALKLGIELADLLLVVNYPTSLADEIRKLIHENPRSQKAELKLIRTGKDIWMDHQHRSLIKKAQRLLNDLGLE